jgi:hypothetical protein
MALFLRFDFPNLLFSVLFDCVILLIRGAINYTHLVDLLYSILLSKAPTVELLT